MKGPDEDAPLVESHYRCPDCLGEWNGVWDSACDDECGNCGARAVRPLRAHRLGPDGRPGPAVRL